MTINTHSSTWLAVKKWAEEELKREREDLECLQIPVNDADQCRGGIRQLKALLNLPTTKQAGD